MGAIAKTKTTVDFVLAEYATVVNPVDDGLNTLFEKPSFKELSLRS